MSLGVVHIGPTGKLQDPQNLNTCRHHDDATCFRVLVAYVCKQRFRHFQIGYQYIKKSKKNIGESEFGITNENIYFEQNILHRQHHIYFVLIN